MNMFYEKKQDFLHSSPKGNKSRSYLNIMLFLIVTGTRLSIFEPQSWMNNDLGKI